MKERCTAVAAAVTAAATVFDRCAVHASFYGVNGDGTSPMSAQA